MSVTPDEVSSTVLTFGLRPDGEGWRERALRERAEHHAEAHLAPRDLHSLRTQLPNEPSSTSVGIRARWKPRRTRPASSPLVCTSGSAATVGFTLLDALAATGCRFAYHGDFDWPGIALANRVVRRCGALPWRMGTADYGRLAARSRAGASLNWRSPTGRSGADWDPDLALP
ncbi:DUF2399 domain-containing protein [Streptomyces wuyuanensis]|uniref:DUF2399 domain-containing protein n=1 Tax=Streptomyces wuyuanensis TaxID=1196353 RepID=UPI00368D404D